MREEKSAVIGFENFPKTRESSFSQIDNILKEKLTSLVHKETSKVSNSKLAKIAIEHSPIDLAYAVSHLPPNARPHLFENLPDSESRMKFIVNTDNRTKHYIFKFMKDVDIKKIVEKMPTDDAIDVLDVLSERRLKRVLDIVNPQKSKHIKEQKKHSRNTAGRLMTDDFFAFVKEMTIKEASSYIRDFPHIDFTKGIFIVDEKNELVGYVPGRNLVINSKDALLKQIMRPVEHKAYIKTSREEIVSIFERYKISSLPIINENNKLVGIISDDIALELMEDLADETLSQIGGTEESGGIKDPIFQRFLDTRC